MPDRSEILARDFARNLKRLRRREELSQGQLAVRAGYEYSSRAHICDLETGRQDPGLVTVEKLAQAMGVEPRELFRAERKRR